MRALGIGIDGEYLMALTAEEYATLQALRQAGREAGYGEDLVDVLGAVRAFLDARCLVDDMRLLVRRFEAIAGDLPGEGPTAALGTVTLPADDNTAADRPHPADPHSPAALRRHGVGY